MEREEDERRGKRGRRLERGAGENEEERRGDKRVLAEPGLALGQPATKFLLLLLLAVHSWWQAGRE